MNAKVITVVNQKGGCGKTTISMNLAGTIALRQNKKILIVDGDIQSSAVKWASCAPEDKPFPCTVISLASAGGKAHRTIANFINDYDIIIIDCPPSTESKFSASSLLISDLALIPIKPSSTDLWSLDGIIELINSTSVVNEKLITKLVVNMREPNKNLSKNIIEFCKTNDLIKMCDNYINNRAIYGEVGFNGMTVYQSANTVAKNEIALLADEIMDIVK